MSYTCDLCREEVDRDQLKHVGDFVMQQDLKVDICHDCMKRPISDLAAYLEAPLNHNERYQEIQTEAGLVVRTTLERT